METSRRFNMDSKGGSRPHWFSSKHLRCDGVTSQITLGVSCRSILGVRVILHHPKLFYFLNCLNKCRVAICWGLLLSKLIIPSENVLISKVDVHLSHIIQPAKFHCHIIIIGEGIFDF